MNSLRDKIDEIKSKIKLSDELSKHTKLVNRGNDLWCSCLFHNEKTPSMKINEELSSYYCFGCGAKGDLISFYTDYLKYSFNDALIELSRKAGVTIDRQLNQNTNDKKLIEKIDQIYLEATNFYCKNLYIKENKAALEYLKKRNISEQTINFYKIGYSYNRKISLYNHLKNKSFEEDDLVKSNLFKINTNNKRDFFYKRLMFPIINNYSKIVGFGGRTIENIEPKYINSAEGNFFKKRKLLFNLENAKKIARKKNNLLICEGYMDVISLADKGVKSVVAPLGTSMTEEQLLLAWRTCKIPTIMFDGDIAGKKASIKSALLALKFIKPGYSLNFLELPDKEDPDSFINKLNKNDFVNFLKNSKNLSNFIFDYAKNSFQHQTPDQKIIFDKYFDDITDLISDKKVKFFYKREFKNKLFSFFNIKINKKLRNDNKKLNEEVMKLKENEYLSFIATFINHQSIRADIIDDIIKIIIENDYLAKSFEEISKRDNINLSSKDIVSYLKNSKYENIVDKALNRQIYQLFPYSSPNFNSQKALQEVKKSAKIIDTRLSNLAELDKSIKNLESEATLLNWQEFEKLSYDYISELE